MKHMIECDLSEIITPELAAEIFAEMSAEDQARFFNKISEIATTWGGGSFPMQLQYITEEDCLSLGGRRVMQGIGEYSHWGLTCRINDE